MWQAMTTDYQIYSMEHDRAYYPYRCVIDRSEDGEDLRARSFFVWKKSLVLVLNHPQSTSFSADDVLTLLDNPEIKTIVAAGHDGSVYVLSIGDGKRVDINFQEKYNNAMRDNNKDTHVVMLILSEEYGWRYKKV